MILENVVQSTISSLGYFEDGVYFREPDCFDSIRDLIRFLHQDDKKTVRRLCTSHNLVKNDLVPIMMSKDVSEELFDAALRLTVNLCQPTLVAFGGKQPEDNEAWKLYYELEDYLRRSLSAFTDPQIFRTFLKKMQNFFSLDWESRNERSKLLVERIIVLIRYIFALGTEGKSLAQVTELELRTRERVTHAFLTSSIPEFFVDLVHNSMEREFCLHILNIFALIVQPFKASDVAFAGKAPSAEVINRENQELQKSIEYEREKNNLKRFNLSARNFLGGTYVVSGTKALNQQNELILQKPIVKDGTPIDVLSKRKTYKRLPRNRRIQNFENDILPSSMPVALETRLELKKFCDMIIQRCYNKLMKLSKEQAFNSSRSLTFKYSEVYYFLMMEFFLEYARLTNLTTDQVNSTFGKDAFHHVLVQLDNYFEMLKVDKQNLRLHTLKSQHAISAYKQMIMFLHKLLDSKDSNEKEVFNQICYHIFQVEEFRELGFNIMSSLSPSSLTKKMLQDLVLVNHYYIHIMEKYTKRGELIKVEKRKKVANRRKKAKVVPKEAREHQQVHASIDSMSREELDELWETLFSEINEVVSGIAAPTSDVSPVDALINVDEDKQQAFAMLSVQRALRDRRVCDAVGIYRAARELWPNGNFGHLDISVENEIAEFREIFLTDLTEIATEHRLEHKKVYGSKESLNDEIGGSVSDKEQEPNDEKYTELDEDREEEETNEYIIMETPFNFDEYISHFAKADIISWYIQILKDFDTNSEELNKAILKLFHRIAFGLKSPPRLYQASLFQTLLKVNSQFENWPKEKLKVHKHFRIYEFGHHLLKKFFEDFEQRGELLAVEILLPKTAKDCYEIQYGYGSFEGNSNDAKDLLWPEELEEELKGLYYEFVDYDDEDAKKETDLIKFIENGLSKPRTFKQITKQLKQLGLPYKGKNRTKGSTKSSGFDHSTEFLQGLIEQYNNLDENFKAEKNMIDYLKDVLPGEYSRKRIIKELTYRGISYEKGKKIREKHSKNQSTPELRSTKSKRKPKDPLSLFEPGPSIAATTPAWKTGSLFNDDLFDDQGDNSAAVQDQPRYKGFVLDSSDSDDSDSSDSPARGNSPLLTNLEADTFDLRLDDQDDLFFGHELHKNVEDKPNASFSQQLSSQKPNKPKESRRFLFASDSEPETGDDKLESENQDASTFKNGHEIADTFDLGLDDEFEAKSQPDLNTTRLAPDVDSDGDSSSKPTEQNPSKKRKIISDSEDEDI